MPALRVPVVVSTTPAICVSTAKFDYVDGDEVRDHTKCFPVLTFSFLFKKYIYVYAYTCTKNRLILVRNAIIDLDR